MKVKYHKIIGWYISYKNDIPTLLEHEIYCDELNLNKKFVVSLTSEGDKK